MACFFAARSRATEVSGFIRYDGPLEGKIIVQAWVPRAGNRALQLDGKTGCVVTDLTDLSGPELTIQFWFKGASIQSAVRQQNGGLEDFEEEWTGRGPGAIRNPPRGWIVAGWHGFHLLSHDGLLNGIYYDREVTDNRWHHVAMTWKQNTKGGFASYMDGRLYSKRDTRNLPIPNYNSPVYFGSFHGGSEFASGMLDEISIWRRAFSASEISNTWHHTWTGNEPGLAGLWNFDGAVPDDCSTNHFRGQMRGAASLVDADVPGLGLPSCSTSLNKLGRYQLSGLVDGQDYKVVAFLDVNGNLVMDPWEPRSAAPGMLRTASQASTLDLHLGVPIPFWRTDWFLGLAGFLFLAGVWSVIWRAHSRKMRWRYEELHRQHQLERERGRIAREIHDELGAKLARISYLSEVAKSSVDNKKCPEIEVLGTATRELLRTLDTIVWTVSPRYDTVENLVEYACQYATEFFSMTGVECDVSIPGELPDHALTSQARHELMRVIQESLNNALKHARATKVTLKFEARDGGLEITIGDNGRGFDPDGLEQRRCGGGNGLRIMRERMTELGGSLQISTAPGEGTVMLLELPLTGEKRSCQREIPRRVSGLDGASRETEPVTRTEN
ncbi:MAG TPA: ATP-binding protein [Verrucomicrobiae bacterium]|nr:ATP-binding protein [Verrucomicrobiae bacterium]